MHVLNQRRTAKVCVDNDIDYRRVLAISELRNRIYNYALHEPGGRHYEPDENFYFKFQNCELSRIDANQLQFLNRQLRQGTRALRIREHELFFEAVPESPSSSTPFQD